VFTEVAWHTGRNHIFGGMVSTTRQSQNMVLGNLLGLLPAVRAPSLVGHNDSFPLRGGEGCHCSKLLSATAAHSGTVDVWVRYRIRPNAETHGLFMRLLPKTVVFWMRFSIKTIAFCLVLLVRRVICLTRCSQLLSIRRVVDAFGLLRSVGVGLAPTLGSKALPFPLLVAC